MDEKTPHLHLTFMPLTKDNRLCANDILSNQIDFSHWQDDFHAHMVQAYLDLEREEIAQNAGSKHISTRRFKQALSLSKPAKAIENVLDSITPLNDTKKKRKLSLCWKMVSADVELQQTAKKVQDYN